MENQDYLGISEQGVKSIVTDEQIAAWKAKYGRVVEITVMDDGKEYKGYFKRPTMDVLTASGKMAKTDSIKSLCIVFDGCWLGGSPELETDAVLKINAGVQLNNIITVQKTELKNL